MTDITIRRFATIEEFRACVDLQEATWGVGFSERVSPAILKVGQMLGGVSAGAYDAADTLVGFVFGLTGVRDGEVVHWSDMLAVRPEVRDTGLGRRLKAYQREQVMALGVDKMFWTFDPLRSRNAHLNLTRLGIVVREYAQDMYGQTDSPLHHGIGTDRFIALWLLGSERVRRAVEAVDRAPDGRDWPARVVEAPRALVAEIADGVPLPGTPDVSLDAGTLRVEIPSDLDAVTKVDLAHAVAWRVATRSVFTHYLAHGYEVRYFLRGSLTSTYGLVRRDDTDDQ